MFRFQDKVILITGGSSGIGQATAYAFASEKAKVVLAARHKERGENVAREIKKAGGEAVFIRADVSKTEDVKALVEETVRIYGRLNYAFNNAATEKGTFAPTADFSEKEFDSVIQTNLKGVWLCMKYEIQQMLKQSSGGVIINTSSVNGLGGGLQAALYSATKSGVIALTKSAAQEYAQQRIRVNVLVAGVFRTPMLERVFDRAFGDDLEAREAGESEYTKLIPMGRIGSPKEAAEAVLWLCSDAASYITGHSMIVDGGLTAALR
jgi:NAD(P)-dependent dehydrogenase (short-subunit alcohol dehydrogenase family)